MTGRLSPMRRPGRAVPALAGLAVLLAACSAEAPPRTDPQAVARGERLSHSCTPCHNLERKVNRIGPHLVGIVGRPAGTAAGYNYSEELKGSGIVWTAETIETYIQWPLSMVPGGRMALAPMPARDAKDIVAYLRSIDR